MDTENNPDLQEIPLEIHGDEVVAEGGKVVTEGDSYDELAKDVEVAMEPPVSLRSEKRGRGRPLGAKNKKKVPEPEAVSDSVIEESEPDEPETPHLREVPKRRKARASPMIPVRDVEFDEGYGGAGPPSQTPLVIKKPVRVSQKRRQPASRGAVSLMEIIAQAASQHGERERDRRRSFYENYLPM